jgi:adenosylcobinamide kinase/adenosylcobinamide-phosphate guanylyltransferase
MLTVEAPRALSEAIAQHSRADTLVVVDCLTLWLTHWLMPVEPVDARRAAPDADALADSLCATVRDAPGPLVLVGNEIGLGVIPLGREVRAFVDALGRLNQAMAATCGRVTWMAAGLPMPLKVPAA